MPEKAYARLLPDYIINIDFLLDSGKLNEKEKELYGKATTMSLTRPNSSVCFYHGFVLGLMVELGRDYRITSNRESGFGRYDVMMEPYQKDRLAYVLEFKVHDPEDENTLEETVQEALRQFRDKGYDNELTARGIPKGRIRHYGFAFEGKQVLIGQGE